MIKSQTAGHNPATSTTVVTDILFDMPQALLVPQVLNSVLVTDLQSQEYLPIGLSSTQPNESTASSISSQSSKRAIETTSKSTG